MVVKLFSTPVCPYCHTLREFLKEKNIAFEDIDVSKDEKLIDELVQRSGQMGVPVVEIDGQIIIGFDRAKICELLKINC